MALVVQPVSRTGTGRQAALINRRSSTVVGKKPKSQRKSHAEARHWTAACDTPKPTPTGLDAMTRYQTAECYFSQVDDHIGQLCGIF